MSEKAFVETGVAELTVPSSVEMIGASCFYCCGLLKSIAFESGSQLRRIERSAFADTPLTELRLPNSVRFISGLAFNLTCLKSISFHPCPTTFRVRDGMLEEASGRVLVLFLGSAPSVVVGQSVETIGDGCFGGHETLEHVSFESGSVLERIGEWAFVDGKLTGGIVIPRSVRVLARYCFYYCESLTSVTFESGSALSEIGERAFADSGLTGIVIPASIRVIGEYAFAWSWSLASVTFEEASRLREIGHMVFHACPCQGRVKIPRLRAEEGAKTKK
jgi:hypothetical protein